MADVVKNGHLANSEQSQTGKKPVTDDYNYGQNSGVGEEFPPDVLADTHCGYGNCTPDCLQTCNHPKSLLAAICCYVFVQCK